MQLHRFPSRRVIPFVALVLGIAITGGTLTRASIVQSTVVGATAGKFSAEGGTASYVIPIAVAPGTNGAQPALSLVYTSQSGNGIGGTGWTISGLSVIHRCGSTIELDGVKGGVYYDNRDKFCLDGERLIALGGSEYRTRHETWQKIIASDTTFNPQSFVVYGKDGSRREYTGVKASAPNTGVNRHWLLTKAIDANDNFYTVSYEIDNANGDVRPGRIDYTGNSTTGLTPYNSVVFSYEGRSDVIPQFEAGSLVQVTKRINRISSYAGTELVREYRLAYDNAGAEGRSRLTHVQECGVNNACLPPSTFTYQNNSFDGTFSWGSKFSVISTGGNAAVTADFNGDGWSDFMANAGENKDWRVYLNNKDGTFTQYQPGIDYRWGGPTVGDFNGDGKSDFLINTGDHNCKCWKLFLSNGDATFNIVNTPSSYKRLVTTGDFDGNGLAEYVEANTSNGEMKRIDFNRLNNTFSTILTAATFGGGGDILQAFDVNSDGRDDLVISGGERFGGFGLAAGTSVWVSTADGNFQRVSSLTQEIPKRIVPVDINGNGLLDVVGLIPIAYDIYDQPIEWEWRLYRSRGNGTFEPKGKLLPPGDPGSVVNAEGVDSVVAYGADFDGDGRNELVFNHKIYRYLNSGSLVDTGKEVCARSGASAAVGDFNGDGRSDVVGWSGGGFAVGASCPGAPKSNLFEWYVFHAPDVDSPLPDMMLTATDGLGNQAKVTYASLLRGGNYTPDPLPVHPIHGVTPPVHAVFSVDRSNGIGGFNTTTYKYGGLKSHFLAAASLGFRFTETIGPDGLRTRTFFNQTLDGTEGTPASTETWAPTPTGDVRVRYATNTWGVITPGPNRLIQIQTSSYEQTLELDRSVLNTTTTTTQHDAFGYPEVINVYIYNDHQKTTTNTYLHDTAGWRLGQLTRATVTAVSTGASPQTRTSAFTYDTRGRILTETVEPGSPTLELKTAYEYDDFGNRTKKTVTGPDIEPRDVERQVFDARGQFVVERRNALEHTEYFVWDARWGVKRTHRGPNNLSTSWTYDGLGRQIREDRADGTFTATEYLPESAGYATKTTASGAGEAWVFHDILGRKIRTAAQGFGGNWIYQDTEHNTLGLVTQVSHPYFQNEPPHYKCSTYDVLGRVLTVSDPCGGERTISYTYYARCTTTTNPLGQQKTICNNSQGKMATANDAGGTTTYEYDSYANLTRVIDPVGNQVTMQYDLRGRKTAMNDPDMGSWSYVNDALSQLRSQTDAKGQTVSMTYDKLGRMRTRTSPEGTSEWVYDDPDPAKKAIGKLVRMVSPAGDSETYTYDQFGRASTGTTTIGGEPFTVTTTYDANSRVDTVTYPQTGYKTRNIYDSFGHLFQVQDVTGNPTLLWQAASTDAHGRITHEQYGNLIDGFHIYSHETGDLQSIRTLGQQADVQNFAYTFDAIGNLRSRTDNIAGFTENFAYDALNRLTAVQGPSPKTLQYDNNPGGSVGNIAYKSDVGHYIYPLPTNARPHAVKEIRNESGQLVTSFGYDANGNMTSGYGRTIAYTSFNKPSSIARDGNTTYLTYDANYNRIRKATSTTTTLYIGKLYEKVIKSGTETEHKHYVYAGKSLVAVHTQKTSQTSLMRYIHTDHLGSITAITDENGAVVARFSYDAHGKRRNNNGTDITIPETPPPEISRGFTGHEMDDEVGLINMNARLYDPVLGRFLTPDTFVQFPDSSQGMNRYTYVNNNPLSYTDPSGHFLKRLFKGLKRIVKRTADYVQRTVKRYGRLIVAAVVAYYTFGAVSGAVQASMEAAAGACFTTAPVAATVAGGAAAGFAGGAIRSGDLNAAFRSGIYGGISAGLFSFAGSISEDWEWYVRPIPKAIAGGISSEIQGGDFGDSFRYHLLYHGSQEWTDYLARKSGLTATDPETGKLRTDGGRRFCEGCNRSIFSSLTMGMEGSGDHWYEDISAVRNIIVDVSKTHDFLNSWRYSFDTGQFMPFNDVVLDSLFDVYSFAGMLPAAKFVLRGQKYGAPPFGHMY